MRSKKLENLRTAKCATVKRSEETRCKHQRKTQFLHSIPYSYPLAKITSLACHHSWWFISCVSTTVFILVRPVISPIHPHQTRSLVSRLILSLETSLCTIDLHDMIIPVKWSASFRVCFTTNFCSLRQTYLCKKSQTVKKSQNLSQT